MRKIFLPPELYTWIQDLWFEDKWKLLDYFYKYNLWIDFEMENNLKVIFWFFKPFFDNDKKTYDLFCESRKINGNKWWRPEKNWENSQKPKKPTEAKEPIKPKKPTEKKWIDKKWLDVDKILYLDYVYLTIEEYNKLIDNYWKNNIDKMIDSLNTWIWSKWYEYKSHYFTILAWLRNAGIQKKEHKEQIEVPTTDNFFTSLWLEVWN